MFWAIRRWIGNFIWRTFNPWRFKRKCSFDDLLQFKQKEIDLLLKRGRRKRLKGLVKSQPFFNLSKTTIEIISFFNIFLYRKFKLCGKQFSRDIACFDLVHDEFRDLCREHMKKWRLLISIMIDLKCIVFVMRNFNFFEQEFFRTKHRMENSSNKDV